MFSCIFKIFYVFKKKKKNSRKYYRICSCYSVFYQLCDFRVFDFSGFLFQRCFILFFFRGFSGIMFVLQSDCKQLESKRVFFVGRGFLRFFRVYAVFCTLRRYFLLLQVLNKFSVIEVGVKRIYFCYRFNFARLGWSLRRWRYNKFVFGVLFIFLLSRCGRRELRFGGFGSG